ncbi:uncharacterized protein EV154DRAFT_488351 [Mucor mucedo]|uniref:uncharacterized protein n=1 Tax=Mucor mucedo TaxID=29922 RepID=UPI00222033FC|nr:uncharacterized protein EV154DRAFT_488351 [Mucor mucedo]KAI7867326.1 hypothetical protein EV154DRAFT_488351 [Mucor mucedo]
MFYRWQNKIGHLQWGDPKMSGSYSYTNIRVLENSPKFERFRKNNFRESEIKIDGVIIGQSFKIRLLNYIAAAKHGVWSSVDTRNQFSKTNPANKIVPVQEPGTENYYDAMELTRPKRRFKPKTSEVYNSKLDLMVQWFSHSACLDKAVHFLRISF